MSSRASFPTLHEQSLAALAMLNIPIHIYSFSQERICWANAAALEMWQAGSLAELQQRQSDPHSTAIRQRLGEYEQAFERGESRTEVWTLYPQGNPITIHSQCQGVQLAGHERAMLVESRPIKQAALPAADLRALEAVRHAQLIVSLYTLDGVPLMRNPAAAACFAELDDRLAEQGNIFRAMFANARDADSLMNRVQSDGFAAGSFILALPGHPLHRVQVRQTSDPVTGAPALLVLQEDVSVNHIIYQKLQESEDAFQSILELTSTPVVVVAAHTGFLLYSNTAAINLFGETSLQGALINDLFFSQAALAEFRVRLMAHGGAVFDTMIELSGKALALASVAGSKVRYEGQDAVILTIALKDSLLSESAQLKQALAVQMRSADLLRQQFACAAHEFRTPLAIIDSTAQRLARHKITPDPEGLRFKAEKIRRNVRRILQLLDFGTQSSPSQDAPLHYSPALGDLGQCIKTVVQVMQEGAADLQIDCRLGDLPMIWIDQTLIEHLFENLIGNSVKYSDGPTRVEIRSYLTAADIEIIFRDWGIGIPPGETDMIFTSGGRASNATGREGSGLGLFIAARIMAMHGGQIEFVEMGEPGARFKLRFPREFNAVN